MIKLRHKALEINYKTYSCYASLMISTQECKEAAVSLISEMNCSSFGLTDVVANFQCIFECIKFIPCPAA